MAESILYTWSRDPEALEARRVDMGAWAAGVPVVHSLRDGAPDLHIPGWDGYTESWPRFEQRARAAFEVWMAKAEPAGLRAIRESMAPRRGRDGRDTYDRLRWLARRHLLGHRYSTIGADVGVERQAVAQACKTLAASLGLST